MEFLNEESYLNIVKFYKINNEISNNLIEISSLDDKKKSNEAILDLQENIYSNTIVNKLSLLKKYKFIIIKQLLNYNKNKNIIVILNNIIQNNLLLIQSRYIDYKQIFIPIENNKIQIENNKICKLNKYFINNEYEKIYNLAYTLFKKHINDNISLDDSKDKILLIFINNILLNNRYINKKDIKLNNIYFTFYKYCTIYKITQINEKNLLHFLNEFLNFSYHLNIYKNNIKYLQIDFKMKYKDIKYIKKLSLHNNKLLKDINKTYQKNELISKKCNEVIIKYKYNEKIINNQYIKYNRIQMAFIKNITDIDLNIIILKKDLKVLHKKKDKLEKVLENYNKLFCLSNDINDNCSICLNKLDYCIKTKCSHHFHYSCMISYIYNIIENSSIINILCPICRQYI